MRKIAIILIFFFSFSFIAQAEQMSKAFYAFDNSNGEIEEASQEFDTFHPEKFERDGTEYIGFPLAEAKEIAIRLIEKNGNDEQIKILKEIVELQSQQLLFKDDIIVNYKEQMEICKDAFKEANEASKPSFWDRKPVVVALTFLATTAAIYAGKELAEN